MQLQLPELDQFNLPIGKLADLLRFQLGAAGVHFDCADWGVIAAKKSAPYERHDWLSLLRGARAELLVDLRIMVLKFELPNNGCGFLVVNTPGKSQWSLETLMQLEAATAIAHSWLQQNQQMLDQQRRIGDLTASFDIAEAGVFRASISDGHFYGDATVIELLGFKKSDLPITYAQALEKVQADSRAALRHRIDRVLKHGGKERVVLHLQDNSWVAAVFRRDTQVSTRVEITGLLRSYTMNRKTELESEQHQAQLEALVKQLRASNRTDPLTGLANRIELNERLSVITRENRSAATWISMLVLDIDHFKSYNDSFGHAAGDGALKEVAAIIKRSIGPNDLAARFGGEEFCVLTAAAGDEALTLAQTVRLAIENAYWPCRAVTVSIGVCSMPAAQFQSDTLFKTADNALYQAKRDGRNCVRVQVLT
jgi:diguanylate cyclase (GGDEF)-like protein